MPEITPQDHKKSDVFAFTVKGKKHVLPKITEATASKVPGGVTVDAVMYPDDGTVQMRLALFMLSAVDAKPEAMKALRSLPTDEMLEVVTNWMGESSASSD